MKEQTLRNIIEALLLSAEQPLSVKQLMHCFDEWERPDAKGVDQVIQSLIQEYETKGIELVNVANGYRVQTRPHYSHWIAKLTSEKPPRYSRALMETLAIIAYKQPVTRADIEDIRGVAVSSTIIKTLLEREWIKIAGHRDVPGKPAVYSTTADFLHYFNLSSLNELPLLKPME